MTQLALIPPIPHLRDFANKTNVSLLLAHLCLSDRSYVDYFRERRLVDDYLILDNSAFEMGNSVISMPGLLALAYYLQCQEVVAPDSIMNEMWTYTRQMDAIHFMASNVGQAAWQKAGRPRIMVAPQIDPTWQDIDAYDRHARLLLDLWHMGAPYLSGYITLGVAKNFNKLHGGWLLLFRQVITFLQREYPIQVHCLGLPKSVKTIKKLLGDHPYIRSLDTALPFVCARRSVELSKADGKVLPSRPENYLSEYLVSGELEMAFRNVDYLLTLFEGPIIG